MTTSPPDAMSTPELPPELPATALRRGAVRGSFVLSGGNIFSYALSFATTIVLARILVPSDFGAVALAVAVAEVLFLAASWSLPIALIREPAETAQRAFDSALVLMAPIAAVTLLLGAAVAALIWIGGSARIGIFVFVIIAGRIVGLVGQCFAADLDRRFAYRRVSLLQIASVIISIPVAVGLAAAGAGAWSLALRDVCFNVTYLLLAIALSSWRPTWSFDTATARRLLVFGAQMIGSRLGDMLFHRYDNLVVGAFSGTHTLGLYNQAYVLTETGNKVFGPVLAQVPLAAYARMQHSKELTARTFDVVTFFLVRGVVPLAVLFLVLPGELLTVVLGPEWRAAETILQLLSVYALLLPLFDHMRVLLVANGAVGDVLRARAVQTAFFIPAAAVGAAFAGGEGAAAAVAVGMVIGTAALFRGGRGRARLALREFVNPLVAGAAAAAATLAVPDLGDVPRLLFGAATLVAVYAGVLLALEHERLIGNVGLVRDALRRRPVGAAPVEAAP